ncbi:hypothetical protein V493_02840 [Pseudogymnoascus sp. VKM F-4281 (FW-2241)]|nr:hypothetical protein V493_02840 [Pseudogymnoascus sp. VKM F-4281 (FW-2241)]
MALIQKDFVSAVTYNSLPTIQEVANVPQQHATDIRDLRLLLAKHEVPESVSIRLIHRHYDIADGEAMVFRDVTLPAHGTVEVMRATPIAAAQFHGMNFLVSSASQLQAYEYTTEATVDISKYGTFIAEFVEIVVERKLQHRFGLSINHCSEIVVRTDRTEFEFPEEKCTITIPINLPLPEATYEVNIVTAWGALDTKSKPKQALRTQTRCSHADSPPPDTPPPDAPPPKECQEDCAKEDGAEGGLKRVAPTRTKCSHAGYVPMGDCRDEFAKEDGMRFDGRIIQSGTPFHGLLSNLMEVW